MGEKSWRQGRAGRQVAWAELSRNAGQADRREQAVRQGKSGRQAGRAWQAGRKGRACT
jgi:hypothetical protein